MADDKHKTKQALLGELESIKSLLDDDIIDFDDGLDDELDADDFDPPILTQAIDHEPLAPELLDHDSLDHDDGDIPILTEAFETTFTEKSKVSEQSPTEKQTPIKQTFEEPIFEDWPEVDPEPVIAKQKPSPKAKPSQSTLEIESDLEDEPREEIEGSLFDNLETEFKQQWQQDDEEIDDQIEPSSSTELSSTEQSSTENREEKSVNSAEKEIPIIDNAENQRSLFDSEPVDQPKTSADKKVDSPNQDKVVDKTNKAEQIPVANKPGSSPTLAPRKSTATNTSQTNLRPIKADNPFLPKHIRDRLHTSRSLQDEIMDSPFFKTAVASNEAAVKPVIDIKSPLPDTVTAKQTSSKLSAPEQAIIDELVADYLPKIEHELRKRLQALIAKSMDEQNHQDK